MPDSRCVILYDRYDRAQERRREALFALGNGRLLVRGCAPDASIGSLHHPGTYRAGCYDRVICEIAGERIDTEALVNLPNWLPLSFRVAGESEWFALDRVEILSYRHVLALAPGTTRREVDFRDGSGRRTQIREERLVSMAEPQLAALRLAIRPQNWAGTVEIRSAIDGAVTNANLRRYMHYPQSYLEGLDGASADPDLLLLRARTRQFGVALAVAVRTRLVGACGGPRLVRREPSAIAEHRTAALDPERTLTVEKVAAIVTARDPASGEPGESALAALRRAGSFAELAAAHKARWARLWRHGRIGAARPEVARALDLCRFHLLQTISPHSPPLDVGFPARGWQEGYFGQAFWDDVFAFPFLVARFPALARALLLYRWRRLDAARQTAREHGCRGAMFPWRSAATGREATPSLQLNLLSGRLLRDHTHRERHIGAAVAFNIWQYWSATGDRDFMDQYGAEMLLEIARFWASLARFDPEDERYDIRGVIGPDEFHDAYPGAAEPGIDNNAYTNVMAAWTLARALDLFDELPAGRRAELCRLLAIEAGEPALWNRVSRRLRLAFHDDGILSQFAGYDRLRPLDLEALGEATRGERADWALEARGEDADAYQIAKQADVLMLFHLLPEAELMRMLDRLGYPMSRDRLGRIAAYYLARTTHDSSLSRIVHAGAFARLDPALSWRLFTQALQRDAGSPDNATAEEGLHLGAMAAVLAVVQRHYLGLDLKREAIRLDPAPPPELGPIRLDFRYRQDDFRLDWDGSQLRITAAASNRASAAVGYGARLKTIRPGAALVVA
ncbi:MAG TPA: glycoside hydrolase family 65 protein [Stellaceae bacterium]|nr:glycoside hydrolase family 65 protein [Stellaceae bacterium]